MSPDYLLQVVYPSCLLYEFWLSPQLKSGFGLFGVFMEFLLPLMILVFCYGRILWVLRRRMDSTLGREGGKDPSAATFQKAQKNVVKTLLLVVLFLSCVSPVLRSITVWRALGFLLTTMPPSISSQAS